VSIFPPANLLNLAQNEEKYEKTPFLYLVSSYSRNKSLDWAYEKLTYKNKIKKGSWMVYSFEKE